MATTWLDSPAISKIGPEYAASALIFHVYLFFMLDARSHLVQDVIRVLQAHCESGRVGAECVLAAQSLCIIPAFAPAVVDIEISAHDGEDTTIIVPFDEKSLGAWLFRLAPISSTI
jgi:hypothetical protein